MRTATTDSLLVAGSKDQRQSRRALVIASALLGCAFLAFAIVGHQLWGTLFSGGVLVAGINLLWRPGETPILIFMFVYQWLQASLRIFQVAATGMSWERLINLPGNAELASYLSLAGLLVLAAGLRLGAGRLQAEPAQQALALARSVSISRWFMWYCIAFAASQLASLLASLIPPLSQPFIAMAGFKWAFFFMLTYASFIQSVEKRLYWAVAFLFELMQGFFSFFSEFRMALFFAIFGIMAAGIRMNFARAVMVSIVGGITLFTAVIWTAVKSDYRDFLSEGVQAQIVTTDYTSSLQRLSELALRLDGRGMELAVDSLIDRLSYVEFFGRVLNVVPTVIPHTDGELWFDAIKRPFMPRAFFPNKTVIDDSERTMKYARTTIIGAGRNTSVSIGYVGESYIDFGSYLMMVPILFYGWLLGRVYRWLVVQGVTRGLLGMGLASAILVTSGVLEASITKSFGGLVVTLLVVWLLIKIVFPVVLPWCLSKRQSSVLPTPELPAPAVTTPKAGMS